MPRATHLQKQRGGMTRQLGCASVYSYNLRGCIEYVCAMELTRLLECYAAQWKIWLVVVEGFGMR
jgi:hypothetical protein